MADSLLALVLLAYVAGALAAAVTPGVLSRTLAAAGALAGAVTGTALGVVCLHTGAMPAVEASLLPQAGFALRVDGLSAFFLIVIGVVAAAGGVYGFGYSAGYQGRYSLRLLGALVNVLLLCLTVQVMADNAVTFLMTWETM